jgi:tRNA threonylcarbamoyladenosine biosynthesis protein TsaB
MQHHKTILAIETSTAACSVALIHEGLLYQCHQRLPQRHANEVLAMIEGVLKDAGIKGQEVELLAFGEGPGAFTGVRIATGVIQGLAMAWSLPVVNVSSLAAMPEWVLSQKTNQIPTEQSAAWVSILDARMNEVYVLFGEYDEGGALINCSEPEMLGPDEATQKIQAFVSQREKSVWGVGDIAEVYPNLTGLFEHWLDELPRAESVARIGLRSADLAQTIDKKLPSPLYLRNHVADTIEERKQKRAGQTL